MRAHKVNKMHLRYAILSFFIAFILIVHTSPTWAATISGTVYTDDDEVTSMVGETVRLLINFKRI